MSIIVNGYEHRTLSQPLYVNGSQVMEAYANGVKVYPENYGPYVCKSCRRKISFLLGWNHDGRGSASFVTSFSTSAPCRRSGNYGFHPNNTLVVRQDAIGPFFCHIAYAIKLNMNFAAYTGSSWGRRLTKEEADKINTLDGKVLMGSFGILLSRTNYGTMYYDGTSPGYSGKGVYVIDNAHVGIKLAFKFTEPSSFIQPENYYLDVTVTEASGMKLTDSLLRTYDHVLISDRVKPDWDVDGKYFETQYMNIPSYNQGFSPLSEAPDEAFLATLGDLLITNGDL